MHNRASLAVLAAMLLPLAAAPAAKAQDEGDGWFDYGVSVAVDDDSADAESYERVGPLSRTVTLPGRAGASAVASLDFGVNKVYAHVESTDPQNPAGSLWAGAWSQWADEVTISEPMLNGTVGTLTATLRTQGSALGRLEGAYNTDQVDAYGGWKAWIGIDEGGGGFLVEGWMGEWYSSDEGLYYEGDPLEATQADVTLEFIYGEPFRLGTFFEVYFSAENPDLEPGTIDVTLDLSQSAYWDGISALRDADGDLVTTATLTSQSGVDWRNPVVPEPASPASLLCPALAGLLRRRRRAG